MKQIVYSPLIKNIALRRQALLSLEHNVKSKKSFELMCEALEKDTSQIIRHEACFLIAHSKRKEGVGPLLFAVLNDPSVLVKHEAIEAIGDLGIKDKNVKKQLEKYACSKNAIIKETTEITLALL